MTKFGTMVIIIIPTSLQLTKLDNITNNSSQKGLADHQKFIFVGEFTQQLLRDYQNKSFADVWTSKLHLYLNMLYTMVMFLCMNRGMSFYLEAFPKEHHYQDLQLPSSTSHQAFQFYLLLRTHEHLENIKVTTSIDLNSQLFNSYPNFHSPTKHFLEIIDPILISNQHFI